MISNWLKFTSFTALLLVGQLLSAQNLPDSTINLPFQQGTVRDFLMIVQEQTNLTFIYNGEKIEDSKSVEFLEKSYSVKSLLLELFKDQDVQIIIRDRGVILKKKEKIPSSEKKKATIHGYIFDGESGENLLGASVRDNITGLGTTANYYGYFSLTLLEGEVNLHVSFIGMERRFFNFHLANDTTLHVRLVPDQVALQEVVVHGDKTAPVQNTTEMGTMTLSRRQIQSRPAIGGEVDVVKTLQLLPGVQSGVEGSAGLYVRGGGPDQNLILLDGVPVYNSSHLFGFSSVFNADAINSVKLIKGAFPARYGGRLSSVIDMSMKEGNNKHLAGVVNISPVASSVMVEGPLKKEHSSFMVAARRSFVDLITNLLTDDRYYFYDVNLKLNHRFSDKDRLFFSAYLGKDSGKLNETRSWTEGEGDERIFSETRTESNVQWGSAISLMRWNHVFNPKLFSNLSLSYSTYDFKAENNFFSETRSPADTLTEYQQFLTTSDISDLSIKLDFDFFPHPNHSFKWGLQAVGHQFKPNVVGIIASEQPDVTFNESNVKTSEYNFYLEDDFELTERLMANIGVHVSALDVQRKFYKTAQPRVSVRWLVNKNLSLKSSFARMTQFLHLLTNPGLGLPTDLWVPVTDRVGPQESTQYTLGLARSFPDLGMEITLEGYYKDMSGLIEYKDGANFLRLNEDWEDKINVGAGESFGIEWFVSRKWDQFEGWFGYTLAWTNRTFEDINFGNQFPYKYDRRHDVSSVLTYQFRKNIHFSANWVYGTGIALTLPSGKYLAATGVIGDEHWTDPTPILNYESRNGFRQRDSHRLDLSASFVKEKKKTTRTWLFTVYNAYNRRNPVFIEARPTQDFNGLDWNLRFKEYSFLSIIPSVTYRLSF